MVTEKMFEAALGISSPWYIAGMNFEPSQRKLMIRVDFEVGSRFVVPGQSGEHPVHDTLAVRLVAQQLKGETLSAMQPTVPVPAPPSAHGMRRAANVRPVLVPENRKVPARGCISGRANRQDIVGLGRPNRNEGAVGQPGEAREAS